jgi:dolichol-phosphate mannosyltransferase
MYTRVLLIPMRNSSSSLKSVFDSLDDSISNHFSQVLVLDNASEDDSIQVLENILAQNPLLENKVTIQRHASNLGYGGSMKWGMTWALENKAEHLYVIHSDDQTNWSKLLKDMIPLQGPNRFVIGSRFLRDSEIKGYDFRRVAGNYFFRLLTRILTGFKMTDPGTAICSIPTRFLEPEIISLLDNGFLFHPQLNLILYGDPRIEIHAVPMLWTDASVDNHFKLFRYGLSLSKFLLRFSYWHRIRRETVNSSICAAVQK